ncbi:MAG: glycosyltransferase, partial [candidate division Zixibacteria bacterium]|nr:glycosyltransferase [candidate division Zixibacteria bacterium]
MRIGVDGHVLNGKFQGSRTYLAELYGALLKENPELELHFFGHWDKEKPFGKGVQYVEYLSSSRWKRLTYQTSPLIKKYNIELFHSTYIAPLSLPCASLLTLHDILFETDPQYFDRGLISRNKILVRRSARKALEIHTISEYTRRNLVERYNLPEEKVT